MSVSDDAILSASCLTVMVQCGSCLTNGLATYVNVHVIISYEKIHW